MLTSEPMKIAVNTKCKWRKLYIFKFQDSYKMMQGVHTPVSSVVIWKGHGFGKAAPKTKLYIRLGVVYLLCGV
jgi:hypothetical protein